MAEEYITITELTATLEASPPDFLIIRKGPVDNKITIANLIESITTEASTSQAGIVQLSDAINSTSLTTAATSNAAKKAYDRGSQALSVANSNTAAISGKANTAHTHTASNITTGVFARPRIPVAAGGGEFGAVRQTDNLNNSTASGYVPSIEAVRYIRQDLDWLVQTVSELELGSTFTPLPDTSIGVGGLTEFPIGTTLLVNAGVGSLERGGSRTIRLTQVGTQDASSPRRNAGSYGSGRFNIDGFPGASGPALNGTWVCRGSYSPVWSSGAYSVRVNRPGSSDEYPALQNCVLMQRIA